jgi:transposase
MGKHINYDQKTNILILQTQKKGPSAIAKELKLPKSTIFNFLKRYQKRGTVYNNYHGGNKPKSIDERTERRLVRNAISNRRKTTRQLKDMLDLECDIRTIRNTLKRNQIRPRRPRKKPSLDKNQMQKRYA